MAGQAEATEEGIALPTDWGAGMVGGGAMSRALVLCGIYLVFCFLLLQALEDELNQKKREQEMFFKLSVEADEQTPASPVKHTKFIPFSSTESS